ncbi:chemotaxis response regulator protein-glutamate methylesterase [bacterium]|nr:chemotaxis response regulator protein-glutamate methylesterase [bacterium]
MTRVFVIAKDAVLAELASRVLGQQSEIEVVKVVLFGEEVMRQLHRVKVDIIAVDGELNPDEMTDLTRLIMNTDPQPIVILARSNRAPAIRSAVDATDTGALGVLEIPTDRDNGAFASMSAELARNLRLMSEIKVIRRWDSSRFEALQRIFHPEAEEDSPQYNIKLVAIGASAGGTKALQSIFQQLPEDFPVPVLVVQHLARGYVGGLARWLADQCPMKFVIAEEGMSLRAGTVYLASDDKHLTVGPDHRILLSDEESVNGFKPSIARLFSSVHDTFGADCAAVLLSGMGNDGAAEMRRLLDVGACTIAQDKETSLIHGIPGEAIKLSAARFILPLQEIPTALHALALRGQVSKPV